LGFLALGFDLKKKRVFSIGIILLIAGGFGNIIDRMVLGYVIDFMNFPFLGKIIGTWGDFSNNMADMYLTAGLILVAIHYLFFDKSEKKKESNGN
jgi:signal peptidase II